MENDDKDIISNGRYSCTVWSESGTIVEKKKKSSASSYVLLHTNTWHDREDLPSFSLRATRPRNQNSLEINFRQSDKSKL